MEKITGPAPTSGLLMLKFTDVIKSVTNNIVVFPQNLGSIKSASNNIVVFEKTIGGGGRVYKRVKVR